MKGEFGLLLPIKGRRTIFLFGKREGKSLEKKRKKPPNVFISRWGGGKEGQR